MVTANTVLLRARAGHVSNWTNRNTRQPVSAAALTVHRGSGRVQKRFAGIHECILVDQTKSSEVNLNEKTPSEKAEKFK